MAANQNGVRIAHNTRPQHRPRQLHRHPARRLRLVRSGTNGVQIQPARPRATQVRRQPHRPHAAPAGVDVVDTNDHFNIISQNTFVDIGTLGIDLAPLGVVNPNDVNDIDTGANYRLNFPDIASATTTGVSGTAQGNNTIELFRTRYGQPGENGPGEEYLGSDRSRTATGDVDDQRRAEPGRRRHRHGHRHARRHQRVRRQRRRAGRAAGADRRHATRTTRASPATRSRTSRRARRPPRRRGAYSFASPVNRGDNLGTKMYALRHPADDRHVHVLDRRATTGAPCSCRRPPTRAWPCRSPR